MSVALTIRAEAVTQNRLAIQNPKLNPATCGYRSNESVAVLLNDPSATERGVRRRCWRRRQQ
jgi:hypothetical protein